MWFIQFLEQTLQAPLKIQTLVDHDNFLSADRRLLYFDHSTLCAIEEGSIAETSVEATQAYQTIMHCGLMYHRHPKLVKRAFFKISIHLVMLSNEAIYTVIYRNTKISKKIRHIVAYCKETK